MKNERLFNQTVTLYVPFRQGLTTNHTYIRVVVPGCHWEENSIQVFRQTGSTVTSNVEIILPRGDDEAIPKQILPSEWARLPFDDIEYMEQFYALALTAVVDVIWQAPRIFRGVLDTRFGWNTAAATTTAMNNLTREFGIITMRDINYQWYGNRRLHHIAVR